MTQVKNQEAVCIASVEQESKLHQNS